MMWAKTDNCTHCGASIYEVRPLGMIGIWDVCSHKWSCPAVETAQHTALDQYPSTTINGDSV